MALKRSVLLLAVLGAVAGCPDSSPTPTKDGGLPDGGDGGTQAAAFEITTLDPSAPGAFPLSLAVKGDTIGVAYFVEVDGGTSGTDGGTRELRYVEKGKIPQKVDTVSRVYGASLAYDSQTRPHIAYLGRPGNNGTFWYEASAELASRSASGTWSSEAAGQVNDQVVGLWSALAIDGSDTMYIGYRNIHYSQFPIQGGDESDVDVATGRPGSWTNDTAVLGQGHAQGNGGMNSLVLANGQPAMAWSGQRGSDSSTPTNVYFSQRSSSGWPSSPQQIALSGNTVTGPSLAWDSRAGFIVAYEDRAKSLLNLVESADGNTWNGSQPDQIFGGSGGWYPSATFTADAIPAVAYYYCSNRSNVTPPCPAAEDNLVLALRPTPEAGWRPRVVDPDGGHWMKLVYWKGRAVVAYKDVNDKVLKLAIEKQ